MNLHWTETALLAGALVVTVAGTRAFQRYAVAHGIVANPNFRSLHERPMPRAGGIVFSCVFLAGVVALWASGRVEQGFTSMLVLGGLVATVTGFVDDRFQMGMRSKLAIQMGLAAWVLVGVGGQPLVNLPWTPAQLDLALSWLALVWLLNVYNFIDGIDGLAASGAVFLGLGALGALYLGDGDRGVILVLALLATCSAGFLLFNWPPARLFMGDAGSLCLGFCFSSLIAQTVTRGQISVWTWLILFGYFAADTTTTTVLRMFLTRHWYGEHRSHAYQNLARVWRSHLRVVRGISLYNVLWLWPLAAWSVVEPDTAPIAAALALTPVVVWTFKYGPRLSSS